MTTRRLIRGAIARVSDLCGVMDFRNRLVVIEFVGEAGCGCELLANRGRRARVMLSQLRPIDMLTDAEMALLTDEEIASIAAYRMGV